MEYQDEVAGTGAAAALAAESVDGTTQEVATMEEEGGTAVGTDGFIVTEAYVVPPATPKKHRGSITGVALLETKTGSTGISVTARSDDNGRDYEQVIWPPAAWVANPRITRSELDALPTTEGKKQSPSQRFGSAISNSKGNGDVDRLLHAAKVAGRTARATYTNITEFIEQFNTLLSGTPVIFTTKEEKNDDPQYQARERINGFYGYDFDLSKLKNYESAAG